jgi:hypothetical protein
MKALPNLIFLLLLLLSMPAFIYYMYTKTYASNQMNLESAVGKRMGGAGESCDR